MKSILKFLEQLQSNEDQRKVEAYLHNTLEEDECIDAMKLERGICSQKEISESKHIEQSNEQLMKTLHDAISNSPLLASYHFQPRELMLIAGICNKTKAHGEQDFTVSEICEMLPTMPDNLDRQFAAIVDLIDREILSPAHIYGGDYHYDLRALYGTSLRLNGLLWNLILGKDPVGEALKALGKGLAKADSAVDSILKMIGVFFQYYPELAEDCSTNGGACYGRNVNLALDIFIKELESSAGAVGWNNLCKKHKLSPFWQKCLLLIDYFNREQENSISPSTLASFLAKNPLERKNFCDKLRKDNLLSGKGLIKPLFPVFSVYLMELSSQAEAALHAATDKSANILNETDQALLNSAYLSRIDPSQTLDQLILDRDTRDYIVTVIQRLKNPDLDGFAAWGLVGASLGAGQDIQHGCNILLHGVPGTGKTFIAGVIANELKRPLIQINANAIRGCFYGESEKQARELFQEMREAVKSLSPVFLLNEGDQLIHRRLDSPDRSADHAENTIQSVFLEEMETFPGILIVTTNLAENLDLAMSRRFHYKLEIKAPDYESRMALWRLHLPSTIPGAQNIPVEALANDFMFTGGQIRLVVQNACHEAFMRGKGAGLTFDDLKKYAILESGTNFERAKQAIGFAR